MFGRVNLVVASSVLALSATVGVVGIATAAPGTFTKITTPSHDITYHFKGGPSAVNNLTVSGTTSHNVTSVDIVCVALTHTGPTASTFATSVPVTGGSFSTVATIDNFGITCRLRAVPTGIDPTMDYLGAYTGPLVRAYTLIAAKDAGKIVGYQAASEVGSGVAVAGDAGQCGVALVLTVLVPQAEVRGPLAEACNFQLSSANITTTGTPTAPTIRVDGKNAYLPFGVSDYLRGDLGLTLPQSAVTTTLTRHTNGDVTVTETAPLRRCDGGNTYPPTSVSCTTLVGTGVTFKRVLDIIRGAHQVEIRDAYVSTDGHHHDVSAQYQFTAPGTVTAGAPGYIYPHHPNSFARATFDQVVTGFGTGPASVIVRSDIFALSADDQTDTVALTWSRPPAKIQFSHTSARLFTMPYSFSVPGHGSASVRFAESEAPLTIDAKKLAAKAAADF